MTKQLSLDLGKELKEAGMAQSERNANEVYEDWSDKAYDLFKSFLVLRSDPFKVEDFREWAKNLIQSPPSLRAYGSLTVRAKREGLIRHVGYAQVKNAKAHMANCSLWKRV